MGTGLAHGLEAVLRLLGRDGYRFVANHLHRQVNKHGFHVAGVHYTPDPASVGLTPQGEITGLAAGELIRKRELTNLHVLDLCSGVGIVGMTTFATVRDEGRISALSFADINIFNVNSVRKTLDRNADFFAGVKTEAFLSDGLKHLEPRNQFDIIVSNPPHFDAPKFSEQTLEPVVLGSLDPGWQFHREFYDVCDNFLSDRGEVWFFENGDGTTVEAMRTLMERNPALRYVESFPDERDPTFFWMITRRVPAAAPA